MAPKKDEQRPITSIADEFLSAFGAYKETLPDIITFAEQWCGKRLYPRQKTLLRLIYLETEHMTDYDKEVINEWSQNILVGEERIGVSPKIWERIDWLKERGYSHFREVEYIGGRRGGKGHIGGIIGAYQAMRLILMDSPQYEYGIDPNKDLYLFVTATNLTQARDYQFKDIAETITNAPAFQPYIASNRSLWLSLRTRADIRKQQVLEHQGVKVEREIASIKIVALSSNSRSGRGAAAFSLFFDEMAHMQSGSEGPQTAEAVYQALTPSLDQLGKDALIYIPTSPYCLVPNTRVLNKDLEWVPVASLEVGDDIVGFDEFTTDGMRCWRDAKVTETSIIQATTYRVQTSGPSVTCTGEHLWLAQRSGSEAFEWVKTKDLIPGDRIAYMGTAYAYDLLDFHGGIEGRPIEHGHTTIVLSIEKTGVQDVVALGTSTNTLMAEGLFSHNTKVGAAYNIYNDGIVLDENGAPKNPNILVIQLPSWESYRDWDNPDIVRKGLFRGAPQVYDEEARRLELRDPDTFKVERRAQWSETINAYLNPLVVDKMFTPLQFDSGIRKLENHQKGLMRWIYRGHADPSQSQANFAMAIGHTEPVLDEESGETFQHVFFDWLHVWKPEEFPDHQIDYMKIQEELVDVIKLFPTLKDFSYDQYGGFVTVPLLKSSLKKRGHSARVHQATFTVQSNQVRAERFKSALGMNWVHAPKDNLGPDNQSLLELELKFLQLKNGKVVKQEIGMITTKDLADCVMEVTSELLSDQIDRYERNRGLNARLVFGAKGGYHTGKGSEESSPRDRLNQVSRSRQTRKTYGV